MTSLWFQLESNAVFFELGKNMCLSRNYIINVKYNKIYNNTW